MPGRDGTGPMGAGPMRGGGFGLYGGGAPGYGVGCGLGMGWRRGCGRGFGRQFAPVFLTDGVSKKDLLSQLKHALKSRLEIINRQLDAM